MCRPVLVQGLQQDLFMIFGSVPYLRSYFDVPYAAAKSGINFEALYLMNQASHHKTMHSFGKLQHSAFQNSAQLLCGSNGSKVIKL